MKKRVKRVSSSVKSRTRSPEKENSYNTKQLLLISSFAIIAALIFFMFASSITITGHAINTTAFQEGFKYLFGQEHTGQSTLELAGIKFLFFILVLLLIYPILKFFPFLEEPRFDLIVWVISFIVAFLATFYIAPAEVYGILQSYTALGITLTSVVPFIIILLFMYKLAEDPKPAKIIMMRLVGVFFAVFLIYRLVALLGSSVETPTNVWEWATAVYAITLAATVAVMVWSKALLRMLLSQRAIGEVRAGEALSKMQVEARIIELNQQADILSAVDLQAAARLRVAAKNLERALSSFS